MERDVTYKIENEIIKLSVDQFRQTIMIAQGDYINLLFASSKEREPLLRTLFGTEKYDILRNRLTEQKKHAYGQCEDIRKDIMNDASWIKFEDDPSMKEKASAHAEAANTQQLIAIVDKLTAAGKKAQAELKIRQKEAEEKYDEAVKSFQHAKDCNERLKEIDRKTEELGAEIKDQEQKEKELKEKEDIITKKKTLLEAKKKELEGAEALLERCKAEAEKAENKLNEAKALEAKVKGLADAEKDLQEKRDNYQKCLDLKKKLEDEKEQKSRENLTLRHRVKELDSAEKDKAVLTAKMKELTDNTEALDALSKDMHNCEKLSLELKEAQDEYLQAEAEYSALDHEYKVLNERYLRGQAGILGEELSKSENAPCPVCGSTHHRKQHLMDTGEIKQSYFDI